MPNAPAYSTPNAPAYDTPNAPAYSTPNTPAMPNTPAIAYSPAIFLLIADKRGLQLLSLLGDELINDLRSVLHRPFSKIHQQKKNFKKIILFFLHQIKNNE